MANWAESICLKCGSKMITEPRLVFPEIVEPSWLDDYPEQVRQNALSLERDSNLPFKYHYSRCENCGVEVLIAVEDPYLETRDGRIAVMLGGKYVLLSDEVVNSEDHP